MPMSLGLGMGISSGGLQMIAGGDFTQLAENDAAAGVYTLNGSPATIGDIIDLDHPDTTFDPETDIDAGGIIGEGFNIEINTPLLTTLLASGFTILIEAYVASDGVIGVSLHDSAFGFERVSTMDAGDVDVSADNESVSWITLELPLPTENAINKLAMTFLAGSIRASLNGGPVAGIDDIILADVDNIAMQINQSANSRLRSFAFYEPVDDADLPTLSA